MPRPTRIVLVRHGQSTWNATGRWQGHADPPLSPLGRAQAIAAADECPPVDAVVSSDLRRANETAELIALERGFGPVVTDARLRERDCGDWTGLTRDEIEAAYPGWLDAGRLPPRFEEWQSVATRVAAALADLHDEHPGGTLLVVAHGGVVRSLERTAGAERSIVKNLGGRAFDVDGTVIVAGEPFALVDHTQVAVTAPDSL